MIRLFRTGAHAHRTPMAYPALRGLFARDLTEVARPAEADLILFAHPLDVADAPEAVVADWRARRRPVVGPPAFDQRDRAGKGAALPLPQPVREFGDIHVTKPAAFRLSYGHVN